MNAQYLLLQLHCLLLMLKKWKYKLLTCYVNQGRARGLSDFIFCCAFVRSKILPRYLNEMQNWASNIKKPQHLALFVPCDFWEWVARCTARQRQIFSNADFRLSLWLRCNSWRHCRKQKNADFLSWFLALLKYKLEMITSATEAINLLLINRRIFADVIVYICPR